MENVLQNNNIMKRRIEEMNRNIENLNWRIRSIEDIWVSLVPFTGFMTIGERFFITLIKQGIIINENDFIHSSKQSTQSYKR